VDANFEAIPDIQKLDGKITLLIASHHGSLRSLKPANGAIGSTIPRAMPNKDVFEYASAGLNHWLKSGVVGYSYGHANSYGHGRARVHPYYEAQGYPFNSSFTTDMLEDFPKGGSPPVAMACYIKVSKNLKTETLSLSARSAPEENPLGAKANPMRFRVAIAAGNQKVIDAAQSIPDYLGLVELHSDNLSHFAIMNRHRRTVKYSATVSRLIIHAPLTIKCTEDFAIPILLRCDDVEIYFQGSDQVLVSFDVESDDDLCKWKCPGEAGRLGRVGNPAAMGGFLDLRVIVWNVSLRVRSSSEQRKCSCKLT